MIIDINYYYYYYERTSENDGINAPMVAGNVFYHELYAGIFSISTWLLDTTITARLSS